MRTISISDHIGVEWIEEPVTYTQTFKEGECKAGSFRLVERENGADLPYQISDLALHTDGSVRSLSITFLASIPALGRKEYDLYYGLRKVFSHVPKTDLAGTSVDENTVTVSTGQMAMKIVGGSVQYPSPKRPEDVPGPIQAVKGMDNVWRGSGRLAGLTRVSGYSSRIVSDGPVFKEYCIRYALEDDKYYAVTIKVYSRKNYALIKEESNLRSGLTFDFSLRSGFQPDTAFTECGAWFIGASEFHLDYSKEEMLGIFVSMSRGGTVPVENPTRILGAYRKEDASNDFIGEIRMNGSKWTMGEVEMWQTHGPDLLIRHKVRTGSREWALVACSKGTHGLAASSFHFHPQSLKLMGGAIKWVEQPWREIQEIRLRSENPLQEYVRMILDWQPNSSLQRPFLLFDVADIHGIKEKASLPVYKELLEAYRDLANGKRRGPVKKSPEKFVLQINQSERKYYEQLSWALGYGPLVYLVSGEKFYAEQIKKSILESLGVVKEMLAVFGHVAGTSVVNRELQEIFLAYDIVADSGVFTEEEHRYIRAVGAWLTYKHLDPNILDYRVPVNVDPTRGAPYPFNFNTDRFVGVGIFALCFPDHPEAKMFLNHALEQAQWQLKYLVLPDGSWPENLTRYWGAFIRPFLPFAYMAKKNKGVDFFADTKLKGLLNCYTLVQTPRDPVYGRFLLSNGYADYDMIPSFLLSPKEKIALGPAYGDAVWCVDWAPSCGWAAPAYKMIDPEFSARLQWAWNRSCQPVPNGPGPRNPTAAFYLVDANLPAIPQQLESTILPDLGVVILRSGYDTDDEFYLLFSCGPRRSHHHLDRGSFSLYAYGIPLSLDSGVKDYTENWRSWFGQTKAHNTLQFGGISQSKGDASILSFISTSQADLVTVDLHEPCNVRKCVRSILFVKPNYFVIYDEIESDSDSEWFLHVLAESIETKKNVVFFKGKYGVDLDVTFLLPSKPSVKEDIGEISGEVYGGEQRYITVTQGPSENYFAVLYPRRVHQEKATVQGLDGVDGAKVYFEDEVDHIFLSPREINYQKEGTVFKGRCGVTREKAGEVKLALLSGSMIGVGNYRIESSEGPVTLTIQKEQGTIEGEIDGRAKSVTLIVGKNLSPNSRILVDDKEITYEALPNGLKFNVSEGRHRFKIDTSS